MGKIWLYRQIDNQELLCHTAWTGIVEETISQPEMQKLYIFPKESSSLLNVHIMHNVSCLEAGWKGQKLDSISPSYHHRRQRDDPHDHGLKPNSSLPKCPPPKPHNLYYDHHRKLIRGWRHCRCFDHHNDHHNLHDDHHKHNDHYNPHDDHHPRLSRGWLNRLDWSQPTRNAILWRQQGAIPQNVKVVGKLEVGNWKWQKYVMAWCGIMILSLKDKGNNNSQLVWCPGNKVGTLLTWVATSLFMLRTLTWSSGWYIHLTWSCGWYIHFTCSSGWYIRFSWSTGWYINFTWSCGWYNWYIHLLLVGIRQYALDGNIRGQTEQGKHVSIMSSGDFGKMFAYVLTASCSPQTLHSMQCLPSKANHIRDHHQTNGAIASQPDP